MFCVDILFDVFDASEISCRFCSSAQTVRYWCIYLSILVYLSMYPFTTKSWISYIRFVRYLWYNLLSDCHKFLHLIHVWDCSMRQRSVPDIFHTDGYADKPFKQNVNKSGHATRLTSTVQPKRVTSPFVSRKGVKFGYDNIFATYTFCTNYKHYWGRKWPHRPYNCH